MSPQTYLAFQEIKWYIMKKDMQKVHNYETMDVKTLRKKMYLRIR